jgi:TPR repeat protein
MESSDVGYSPAKNKIGDCYFSGFGVRQDKKLAIGCYIEAAEMNNSDAMVNLGTIYLKGIPGMINKDYKEAESYFIKARELKNTDAMIHLSYMLRNGLGVEKDEQ